MECKFCHKECKNDNSLRNHERLCKLNPNRQLTTYEKYGPTKGFNLTGTTKRSNQYIKAKNLGLPKPIISEETRRKLSEAVKRNNPMSREDNRKKLSESMKKVYSVNPPKVAGRSKCGNYKGFYCRSSWELAFVIYNLDHNINFIANKKGFKYIWDGTEHTYFPDFYCPDTDTYIEVKGYYDKKAQEKTKQFKGNLLVLQNSDMKPYLEYVVEKYGSNFISLYE